MKKIKYLIPLIIIAIVVTAAIAAVVLRLGTDITVSTNAGTSGSTPAPLAGAAESTTTQTSDQRNSTSQTSAEQDTGADAVTIDGIAVNPQKLIDNLDEAVPKTLKNADGSQNAKAVSVSPDGRYALSTIPEKYKVLLYDTEKNTLSGEFEMLGQDYGFLWSPDSRSVCVSRTARVWIESSVIDTATLKSVDITAKKLQDAFKTKGIKPGYKLNENRPDPYITPIEWSPDGKYILMFYQWTDSKYNRQSGTFVYGAGSDKISRITRNKAESEGGNLPAVKPKDFKW